PVPKPLGADSRFDDDPAPRELYTLSLHDALPISVAAHAARRGVRAAAGAAARRSATTGAARRAGRAAGSPLLSGHLVEARLRHRSEEHTSELQSRRDLVCRLLLEKKTQRTCAHPD